MTIRRCHITFCSFWTSLRFITIHSKISDYCSWTQETVNVACRQLGFRSGNFSFERIADNETHYMLYEHPGCRGPEASVFDCPGFNNISIGKQICREYYYEFLFTVYQVRDYNLWLSIEKQLL